MRFEVFYRTATGHALDELEATTLDEAMGAFWARHREDACEVTSVRCYGRWGESGRGGDVRGVAARRGRWQVPAGLALVAASLLALPAPLGRAGFLAGVALLGYGLGIGRGDLS